MWTLHDLELIFERVRGKVSVLFLEVACGNSMLTFLPGFFSAEVLPEFQGAFCLCTESLRRSSLWFCGSREAAPSAAHLYLTPHRGHPSLPC